MQVGDIVICTNDNSPVYGVGLIIDHQHLEGELTDYYRVMWHEEIGWWSEFEIKVITV